MDDWPTSLNACTRCCWGWLALGEHASCSSYRKAAEFAAVAVVAAVVVAVATSAVVVADVREQHLRRSDLVDRKARRRGWGR